MPSFTTIYRAGVMIATGVIVVKGWQLYGPSTEQVKSFAVEAVELAQSAWNTSQSDAASSADRAADPRATAPPVAATVQAPAAAVISPAELAQAPGPATIVPSAAAESGPLPPLPASSADRLPALLSHLESIGVADPQLTPWGASGELYRFCCRAKLTDTSAVARHFEAVAAEPAGAVEQVVAKLEAWRATQHEGTALR